MMPAIRALFLVLTLCLFCLPATVFACGGRATAALHDCCAKDGANEYLCANEQSANEHVGKKCNGACADCCAHHITEFTVQPVAHSVKQLPHPGTPVQRWSYSEEYSFTDLHLIWTPPKVQCFS